MFSSSVVLWYWRDVAVMNALCFSIVRFKTLASVEKGNRIAVWSDLLCPDHIIWWETSFNPAADVVFMTCMCVSRLCLLVQDIRLWVRSMSTSYRWTPARGGSPREDAEQRSSSSTHSCRTLWTRCSSVSRASWSWRMRERRAEPGTRRHASGSGSAERWRRCLKLRESLCSRWCLSCSRESLSSTVFMWLSSTSLEAFITSVKELRVCVT